MRSIYDYTDYRRFLKDQFLEKKKTNPLFSYRSFNRVAGITSSAFLKQVLDGKRNLGNRGIQMVARGFCLTEAETRHFEYLVKFNQSETEAERDLYSRALTENKSATGR